MPTQSLGQFFLNAWGQGSRSKDREVGSMAVKADPKMWCVRYGCRGMAVCMVQWYVKKKGKLKRKFVRKLLDLEDVWCQCKCVEIFGINSMTLLSFSFWALNSPNSSPSQLSQICRVIGPYIQVQYHAGNWLIRYEKQFDTK